MTTGYSVYISLLYVHIYLLLYFEGVRDSRHPPPALRGPLSRLRRCTRVAFGCGPRFSFPLARLRVAMVRSRRDLYIAPGSRRIRAPRPKLVSQVVHRPAPARAREMFPSSRANGVSPWPAWPAGAAMGRYGPLGATVGRRVSLWAALDRSGQLWAALGSSQPLWAAGATAARWEALGFLGSLWPLQGGGFGESGVRIRARSTYTNTSTTEFHELPSNGLWPQLC